MTVERQPDMAARHFHTVRIVGDAGCPADHAVAAGGDRGEERGPAGVPTGSGALAQRIGDPADVLLGASVVEPDPGEDRLVADAPEKSGEYGQRAVACEVTGKQQHGAAVSGRNAVAPQHRVGQQPPQFQGGAVLPQPTAPAPGDPGPKAGAGPAG